MAWMTDLHRFAKDTEFDAVLPALGAPLADIAGALTVLAALATLAGLLLLRLARPLESKARFAI